MSKYSQRRSFLTREQNKMVRNMLDSQLAAYKNWIVAAFECGEAEYGKSGQSGYEYGKKLLADLRAHEEMCRIFPPDDMWEE